jgi:hypothetical protein
VRSDVIQAKQVTEMPLQGRNWSTLLKQIPGSVPRNVNGINGREAGYDGYADFRVNGKAQNQTQVNLDGGSNVDHGGLEDHGDAEPGGDPGSCGSDQQLPGRVRQRAPGR